MSLFLSIEPLFYVILFVSSVYSFTLAASPEIPVLADVPKVSYYNYHMYIPQIAETGNIDGGPEKTRVKRDGIGVDKFSAAAGMGPMKVAQLFFSMFSNAFTTDPNGGNHPMARTVPGPFVQLIKNKIYRMLAPEKSSYS